jgi:ankyrin repeat protein
LNEIEEKIQLNWKDQRGYAAIHYAFSCGFTEMVELLLELGCDANVIDEKNGRTALGWACIEGERRVVDILVSHGCNLDVLDYSGFSSLTLSLSCSHYHLSFFLFGSWSISFHIWNV